MSLSERPTVISYRTESEQLEFAVDCLKDAIGDETLKTELGSSRGERGANIVVIAGEEDANSSERFDSSDIPDSIKSEGFQIVRPSADGIAVAVLSQDETGAMYGVLDVAEQIRMLGSIGLIEEQVSNPEVPVRAIKFNLPWSPYREGAQNDLHIDTCLDTEFWEQFLDMMAKNRFNVLSLWNLHPFSFMIRPTNFPEACPFLDRELQQWMDFWHSLFRMADERGIETYIVNWNAIVSPEFEEAHGDADDYRDRVGRYTKECITEVINEYKHLSGIGVSLTNEHLSAPGVCDWFRELGPGERQDWLEDTIIQGIAEANRPIKFLDRSVRTDSIADMRRVIDSMAEEENIADILVPTKFNWSHGHSSTELELTHDYSDGTVDDRLWEPQPDNYDIAWTVRNEDFFVLRWGDPEFVRDHIEKNHRSKEYVGGYFIGSEGFIPAKDISHDHHRHQTWQYIFEKQWLFYMVWGRLLYDPGTSDDRFEAAFERRYGPDVGRRLLDGYTEASRMPIELAKFHASTWDYALYSEGFLAVQEQLGLDDEVSPFISIDELIYHETLDPQYISIPEYVEAPKKEIDRAQTTPPELAEKVETGGKRTLDIAASLNEELGLRRGSLECEIQDLQTWGYLNLYFAEKIRAGVALETFRMTGKIAQKESAVSRLKTALEFWDNIVEVTTSHYREHPYADDWEADLRETLGDSFSYPPDYFPEPTFSWEKFRDQVKRDIEIAKQATEGDIPGEDAEYKIE